MKLKTATLRIMLLIGIAVNAQDIIYLSPDGDNTDGLTWATAKTTFLEAFNTAKNDPNPNMVWAKEGLYETSLAHAMENSTNDKIYGGFLGNEDPGSDAEAVVAARAKSDLDNNGVIEPWEFTNTSTFKSTRDNKALSNINAGLIIDGFTFTHHSEVIYDMNVLSSEEVVGIMENYIEWYRKTQSKSTPEGGSKRKTKKI